MSKRVSKAASQELAFLAALESIHADVDISKIAEIQDWSRAVRGKLYGASIKGTSRIPNSQASLPPTIVTGASNPSSAVPGVSGSVASHGSVQYSQMAIPQLIALCKSESSEEAWGEFIRRSQPLITTVVTKAVRRHGNTSHQFVDDLTQDVYLKLYNDKLRALWAVDTLQENAFFGFLKAVAAHTVEDYFRGAASSKRGGAYELKAPIESPSRNAYPAAEREILLEEIDSILKTLAPEPNFARDYAIFWLYHSHGLSATEIAALPDVKISAKGIKSVLLRLRRRIWSVLAQETKDPK
jgi:RNA polymerase sigma factor (sigma-70 family)